MNYWLVKSEADCYSIDDFKKDKKTQWTGVRNYQARNFLKDMRVGDLVIFYHSGGTLPAAVGVAKVSKATYPDDTALNKKDDHYDAKHTKATPLWYAPDLSFVEKWKQPVSLADIKINPKLKGIMLAQQGSRLSVQPVSKAHFEIIRKLGSIS